MNRDGSRESTLRLLRIVWAAILVSLIVIGGLIATWLSQTTAPPPLAITLHRVQIGFTAAMVLVAAGAYYFRMQTYKRNWQADAVTPHGYALGNLVLFALLGGFALAVLIAMLAIAQVVPLLLPGAVILVLLAVNFPTGLPMISYRTLE